MKDITIYNCDNMMDMPLFDEVWQLLEQSFPPVERWDRDGFLAEYENPEFNSMIYKPDKLGGVLNFWDFCYFVYAEHFAVAPELRGQGVGSELMRELIDYADGRALVLEAEPPQEGDIAERRIRFYERLGFFLNPHDYVQPPMGKDKYAVRLVIMSSPSELDKEEYEAVRYQLYKSVYHRFDK